MAESRFTDALVPTADNAHYVKLILGILNGPSSHRTPVAGKVPLLHPVVTVTSLTMLAPEQTRALCRCTYTRPWIRESVLRRVGTCSPTPDREANEQREAKPCSPFTQRYLQRLRESVKGNSKRGVPALGGLGRPACLSFAAFEPRYEGKEPGSELVPIW
jgi:hypothetical protein